MPNMDTDEFTVTEAGMRAVLETVVTQSHALTELSRQVEVLTEQAVITEIRLGEVEAELARQTEFC